MRALPLLPLLLAVAGFATAVAQQKATPVVPPVGSAPRASVTAATVKAATPAAKPATPAAQISPTPNTQYTSLLRLVRYDLPIPASDGFAPTHQIAARKLGQDAIDWPNFTLNGKPVFRTSPEERVTLPLRTGASAAPYFQAKTDDRIEPGNHWLRPMEWRGGRRHIYTVDRTARTSRTNETMEGRYELWTFPVRIAAEGAPVKIVELKTGGATIFKQDGPWRSLTLLLPANTPGKPYELSVDSRPAVKFDIGLQPVRTGRPKELIRQVDTVIPGSSPAIRVTTLERPEVFPQAKEWAADLAEMKKYVPAPVRYDRLSGLQRAFGVEVPRSPITIYAMELSQGMSGGFYHQGATGFNGTPEEYAANLADLGFDAVFDQANAFGAANDPAGFERRATALMRAGVKLGFQYDNTSNRPSLQNPGLAFYAHTLPEWHGPLYRSLSLAAQRFGRLPNFVGFNIGASSDGYASEWYTTPPLPERPWAEGMQEFLGQAQPAVPRSPLAGPPPPEYPFEYSAKTTAEFEKYQARYEISFRQYGYFAEAVRHASPRLVFTTASFGSSPGPGARGGWPWASLPGRVMFEGLGVTQAYDWNQRHASKPLHNVALSDRLTSYWPKVANWSLIDNTQFLFGREAYQRACALALTRGIQGIGTNFLASTRGAAARPDVVAFQREMHAWIHRYGGVYARTETLPTIGVFLGHQEALQRPVLTAPNPAGDVAYKGSHEGKTTEALFLCHAAGWPARIVTHPEILRAPLPAAMQVLLLVGLRTDETGIPWGQELKAPLEKFLARGGRILVDDESGCAVTHVKTDLHVAAYEPQSDVDVTPILFARNQDNIAKLRAALQDLAPPVATSDEPKLWAIPTLCGDTQYVTAINQAYAEGEEANEYLRPPDKRATRPETWKTKANASLYVKPQKGMLTWHTERPIYDVRQARKLTPEEAANVDLTTDAFAWYALPPAEPTTPVVSVVKGPSGYFEAYATISNPQPIRGIPVRVLIYRDNEYAELYGATGGPIRLPLTERDRPGAYEVAVKELLSGLEGKATVEIAAPASNPTPPPPARIHDQNALNKFLARKAVPLIVALTPEQERDGSIGDLARKLVAWYKTQGRPATIGSVSPNGIVEGLQPLKSPSRYPQWRTTAADLVLLGTPTNNVLILDQLRAEIFPFNYRVGANGTADVIYTRSPFVGEMDVVNLVAADNAGLAAAVNALMKKEEPARK
jgi:hypothetical protein